MLSSFFLLSFASHCCINLLCLCWYVSQVVSLLFIFSSRKVLRLLRPLLCCLCVCSQVHFSIVFQILETLSNIAVSRMSSYSFFFVVFFMYVNYLGGIIPFHYHDEMIAYISPLVVVAQKLKCIRKWRTTHPFFFGTPNIIYSNLYLKILWIEFLYTNLHVLYCTLHITFLLFHVTMFINAISSFH